MTFNEWMRTTATRYRAFELADFVEDFNRRDRGHMPSLEALLAHLRTHQACSEAVRAGRILWARYELFLKRKGISSPT